MSSSFSLQNQSRELKKTPHIKRYLSIYIIIIIFIILGISTFWIAGNIFKHNYLEFIKTLSRDENIPIKVIEYKQGWFHSSASVFIPADLVKYAVLFNSSNQSMPSSSNQSGFFIEQKITHGPIVHDDIKNTYTFAIALVKNNVFIMTPGNKKEIIKSQSLALINNQYTNHIEMYATDLMISNNSFKWQGLSGDIYFSLKENNINYFGIELYSNPLTIKYQNYLFSIPGFTAKNDMIKNPIGLWDGSQSIQLPEASLTVNNNKYLINHFNYASKFRVNQQNMYDYTSQIMIAELVIPEFNINPMQINYSITGINAKNLNDFITISKNINNNLSEENKKILINSFYKVLTPHIKLVLDVMNNTNFGKMIFHAKVDWPENIAMPNTMDALKNNIRIRLDISIPITLVDHILISYFNKIQPPIQQPKMPAPPVESLQSFEDEIEQLQDNDQISISTKTRLYGILDQHPDSDAFSVYLDQLVTMNSISEEVATKLKNEYKIIQKIESDQLANQDKNLIPPPPIEPTTPKEMAKERIDAYKNLGYIIQQDDNYIVIMTFENGQFKINDKSLP